ncbi:MAG: hypothetical protein ABR861_03720 [Terriglobales bacterium]|jgi:hypothetical protein
MTRNLFVSIALLFAGSVLCAQEEFFPKNAFESDSRADQFMSAWFSDELRILGEPSLFQMSKAPFDEEYRFLWLRTFHHPIAIRLELRSDGVGILTTKVASGSAGFPQKKPYLIEKVSRPLTREQTQRFLGRLDKLSFWNLRQDVDQRTGNDGSEWIIEGVKGGKYQMLSRWTPIEGAVHELGLTFAFGSAQMSIPKNEVY